MEYFIGDLIKIHTNCLGIIHSKQFTGWGTAGGDFMYKIHFCEEDEPDNRWVFLEDIKEKVR